MLDDPKLTPASDAEWRQYYENKCRQQRKELAALEAMAKPGWWHYMPSAGIAKCGADYECLLKTDVIGHVTCANCLQLLVADLKEMCRRSLGFVTMRLDGRVDIDVKDMQKLERDLREALIKG